MEDTDNDSSNVPTIPSSGVQVMQPPQTVLTGNIQTFKSESDTPFGQTEDSNLTYVTGPDGQMYAYEKPPFNIKQFSIGLLIPLLLIGITGLGNAIFEEPDWPEEPGTDYDAEMQAVNNTTSFSLNLNLTANQIVISCKISTDSDRFDSYWCNQDEQDEKNQDFTIYKYDQDGERKVGTYSQSNKQFSYDDGELHEGATVFYKVADKAEFEVYEKETQDRSNTGDFFIIFCFAAPVVGIIGSIYGFASGKKDLGIGFLASTALLPFALFALLFILW